MGRDTAAATSGLLFCIVLVVAAAPGCSRRPANVVRVKGKVTLGGQPLAGAVVTFSPTGPGNSSIGRTNGEGEYKLSHSAGVDGAVIGDHIVTITTQQDANPSARP